MTFSSHRRTLLKGVCAALFGASLLFTGSVSAAPDRDKDTLVFVNYRDLRDLNPHAAQPAPVFGKFHHIIGDTLG